MTGETRKQGQPADDMQDWYEIELEGRISPGWFDGLDGWEITLLPNGNTLVSGWVRDQPALHGLIALIRDMNLKMVSLKK